MASSAEADPDLPLAISHSLLHDVSVRTRRTRQCARVEGVPPEEFGIARHARSIRDADYCFHDVLRSEAKLIAQGYDREQIKRLPSYAAADTVEAQARDSVGEGTQKQGDDGPNSADPVRRYKLAWENGGLFTATSPDGLRWTATSRRHSRASPSTASTA